VRVVNGYRCFSHEDFESATTDEPGKTGIAVSKRGHQIIRRKALEAAEAISYPVVIKPNIGGAAQD